MAAPEVTERDLHAFVDGALDAEDRKRVETWLANNPLGAARVAAYSEQVAVLRECYDPVLNEPVPSRLLATVSGDTVAVRTFPWQRIAAAIAFLIVGGLTGWTIRDQWSGGAEAEVAEFAINAHAVYVAEKRHAVEVQAADEAHLVRWLSRRLGLEIRTPDLIGLGYRLVGGRLLPDGGLPTAQFMYENEAGGRLTVYVQRNNHVKETAFRFFDNKGVSAFYWVDEHFAYVLAGAIERQKLLDAAKIVHRSLAP